jgi:hypothetical protein
MLAKGKAVRPAFKSAAINRHKTSRLPLRLRIG